MDLSFDTAKGRFNYRVCGVIIHENKLLAMRDKNSPYYYLPGGRVQMGETVEEAVIREMREELNIECRIARPLWLNQAFFTEDVTFLRFHELCLYFLMDISQADILSRGETFTGTEAGHTHVFTWLPFGELKQKYLYPKFIKKAIFDLPEHLTLRTEREPEYRELTPEDLTPDLFRHFNRHQEVTQVWRKIDGQWVIVPDAFTENWGEKEYEFLCWCLKVTLEEGGRVLGSFCEGKLKGLTSVAFAPLGSRGQYREMSCLHVSEELRGQGMGRDLFTYAKAFVRELGGEKLYISSHPCVESQAFYKAMGCVEAEEYSAEHVRRGPFDCQIECVL